MTVTVIRWGSGAIAELIGFTIGMFLGCKVLYATMRFGDAINADHIPDTTHYNIRYN